MNALLLLAACSGGGPTPGPETDWEAWSAPALDAADGDVSDIARPGPQDQWTYGGVFDGTGYVNGRWILHPPQAFVVELLGEDFVQQCVRKMKHKREPASICVAKIPPCRQIRIFRDGSVEYEIEAVGCGLDEPPEDVTDRVRWKYVE